jgi:Trk K+ transport system NAD-binding subunit
MQRPLLVRVNTRQTARLYVVVLLTSILTFTVLYSVGMQVFENEPRSLLRSLQVVMQTLTTIGYGGDAPWNTTPMLLLILSMQAATLLLVFSAFPAVVVPWIEESLATAPPSTLEGLSDHVVVCRSTTHTETLIDELIARDVPYVIVEPDRDRATTLFERDRDVVHGDPTSMETLKGVCVGEARALISDADDEVDLNIIATVESVAPAVSVYSIATAEEYVTYHELAGADRAFLPRKLLGHGLANKVRNTVRTDLEEVGEAFEIAEINVARGSDLDGERLTEDADAATNVIGVWSGGRFFTPPFDGVTLDAQAVLLVVGRRVRLESIARSAGSAVSRYGRGRVVVAGSGVVGRIVSDALDSDGIEQTVLDVEHGSHVDVVGDATDEEALGEAGVTDATTVVLALDDDSVTLLAAFVIQNMAPDVEVVARANDSESVPKLYRAGVDYVLALSSVAGRLLATAVLDADREIALDEQIRVVRREPGALAGSTLEEAALRERTGCSVVAIEHRDGRVSADLRGWTDIEAHDHLVVAGTDEALRRLDELS